MKNVVRAAALALTLGMVSTPVSAQSIGLAGHASTLGLGGGVAVSLSPIVSLRGRVSFQPYEPNRIVDEIDVTASLSARAYSALVDVHPFAGSFHVSAGLVQFSEPIKVVGQPLQEVELDGQMYQPSEIGSLEMVVRTKERAPYAGIGWGKAAGSLGMLFDLGVVFQGEPQLEATVDGAFANDPTFQQHLDAEIAEVEAEISGFKFYPVLSVGFSIGAF